MPNIIQIVEKTTVPDVTVQSALREIDSSQLALAMLGYDEDERKIVLRNMSRRASKLLTEEVTANEEKQPPLFVIAEAIELFEQKLTKYARHYAADEKNTEAFRLKYARNKGESSEPLPRPTMDITNEETILASCKAIKQFIHVEGILALEGIEDEIDHPVVNKALQLLIDGWDPMVMRLILDKTKESFLDKQRRHLDMILDGMESLASAEPMIGIEERLKAHMA